MNHSDKPLLKETIRKLQHLSGIEPHPHTLDYFYATEPCNKSQKFMLNISSFSIFKKRFGGNKLNIFLAAPTWYTQQDLENRKQGTFNFIRF